ncbi:hypothetical protein HMPREF9071_1732 [Capnocytophaga sp. oral taxon 338 str. F0234]|nr:hypothetical protein HMPREF9071_1732 [Capnocytophaga sp. oral taxon 338 str. F0234]
MSILVSYNLLFFFKTMVSRSEKDIHHPTSSGDYLICGHFRIITVY